MASFKIISSETLRKYISGIIQSPLKARRAFLLASVGFGCGLSLILKQACFGLQKSLWRFWEKVEVMFTPQTSAWEVWYYPLSASVSALQTFKELKSGKWFFKDLLSQSPKSTNRSGICLNAVNLTGNPLCVCRAAAKTKTSWLPLTH